MPSTRARMLPLALVLVACAHKSGGAAAPAHAAADAASPAVPDAPASPTSAAEAAEDPAAEPAPGPDTAVQTGERTAAQKVTFDDDADPEPTTQIQGAPKRPPIPRFRLFGTREGDGPN